MNPPERFPPDDPREWLNRARSSFAMVCVRIGLPGYEFQELRRRSAKTGSAVAVFKGGKVVWEKADGTFDDELEEGRK